jgi:glucose-6-phosphate isomerase
MSRIALDYTNMLQPALSGRGIAPDALAGFQSNFERAYADVEKRRAAHELGFFELPYETGVVDDIQRFADGVGQAFDTVVVLGIGGSALGTLALQQALVKPNWNELSDADRDYFPRLYVLDNVDPTTVSPLLERIDVRRTLFNVVSKSGSTAETMAQFLIVRDKLEKALGADAYRSHLVFTTDPEKGVLRNIARSEEIATLPVPEPAALIGVDIRALLSGATEMDDRCRTNRLEDNPAGLFAALQFLAHTRASAPIHVMMAYTDRLYLTADWFRQLWAESLGKQLDRNGADVFTGPTPVKALGATDQHSQVQLYMEGPFDKTVTMLATEVWPIDLEIPSLYSGLPELSYLGGHTLGELLDAERAATAAALSERGRMNMTLSLPRIDAHAIGQLFMLLQIATVYAGAFYNVDPLDQPGVELGKKLTYGLMGRSGFTSPNFAAATDTRVLR